MEMGFVGLSHVMMWCERSKINSYKLKHVILHELRYSPDLDPSNYHLVEQNDLNYLEMNFVEH